MFDDWLGWLGNGVIILIIYIIISNTLWLIFGAKLLQCLPGINIKGSKGTLKIAAMLVFSGYGILIWGLKYTRSLIIKPKVRPIFKNEVGRAIQQGARVVNKAISG
tara:strand:- start:976 stop:1293 length:318 start_codon:yes stop_codon:yes gene_type:complete